MLALLPLLLQIVPSLASLVSGGRTDGVLSAAAKVAREVLGTDDPDQVRDKLSDPATAEAFKAQLESETSALQAQLADVADARHQTIALATVNSPIAWGAPIVSAFILFTFTAVMCGVLWRGVPAGAEAVVIGLIETLKVLSVAVVSYWVGSSAGSKSNGDALRNIAQNNTVPSLGQVAGKAIDGLTKQARG